ncbi:tetratricopeptide repeat protein [Taibaiella chishuiensis]|uniref:Flp pilus assembly protein TadD n=1 Tax=Taibaiella chishuiensis TaxID=1434707 RepID=A0A2P8DB35_9BACT|nr:tetratricopeptide repeat protein [Taibaiella chishuiensis]PSK94428.1 Flp pilus assembly protein TadD [Taibaiella chishuiensis]
MKRLIAIAVATSLAFHVGAQSVQEGEKMINYGRFESAKKALESIAGKEDQANYLLGLSELGMENKDAARQIFSKNPENFYNQAGMARVLFAEGKKDEAAKQLLAIVDKAKKKEWEKYKVAADAITYSNGGNIQDAITWYQKALEINPGEANTLIGLGDAYLKARDGGNAMSSYEKAVEKGTNNSLAYSKIGSLWYAAHKYEDALKNYNLAKDQDPSNPLPYKELANAYYRAGKYDNALTNSEKFLSLSDKSIDDQITYANLLFLSKKYPEAQAKIQELIGKGVDKPYLYRLIGYSAYETKDYEKARTNMQQFFNKQKDASKIIGDDYIYYGKIMGAMAGIDTPHAKMYNDSADYYFNQVTVVDPTANKATLFRQIAEGYRETKEYAKAGEWFGKTVAADTAATNLDYFNWGLYLYYGKKYQEAASAFAAMKTKFPDEAITPYWQGRTAAAIDQDAKTGIGVPFYKEWLASPKEHKDADLMNAYQYLGYYYYNTNNEKEAMEWINKVLEKEPGNEFANQVKDYYAKSKAKAAPAKGKGGK